MKKNMRACCFEERFKDFQDPSRHRPLTVRFRRLVSAIPEVAPLL